jgi:hypothetical protein
MDMNRIAYLVLAAALLAPFGRNAFGETMAERKQRIMRKYLRERQIIVQSDLVMPSDEEEERVAESEKFSQPQAELTRKEPARPVQAPVMVPVPVQAQQNWWLAGEDADADPYADPFAKVNDEEGRDSKAEWWAQWRARQEQLAEEKTPAAADAYGYPGGRGSYSGEQSGYSYTQQPDGSWRYTYGSAMPRTYGGQERGLNPYGTTRYGSSPSSGMLWPSPSSPQTGGSANSPSGYTPYKSPYETPRDQQRQPGYSQDRQQPEFTKPTPYQKWKSDNKGWDPAADDAYLDDLMRRNRR